MRRNTTKDKNIKQEIRNNSHTRLYKAKSRRLEISLKKPLPIICRWGLFNCKKLYAHNELFKALGTLFIYVQ